jgi:hypothetical protein
MHISFKIIKFYFTYAARHVSDTFVSIIRSFLLLHKKLLMMDTKVSETCPAA